MIIIIIIIITSSKRRQTSAPLHTFIRTLSLSLSLCVCVCVCVMLTSRFFFRRSCLETWRPLDPLSSSIGLDLTPSSRGGSIAIAPAAPNTLPASGAPLHHLVLAFFQFSAGFQFFLRRKAGGPPGECAGGGHAVSEGGRSEDDVSPWRARPRRRRRLRRLW